MQTTHRFVSNQRAWATAFAAAISMAVVVQAQADEILQVGKSLSEFSEFLSRPGAILRPGGHNVQFSHFRYELHRGKIIAGGCEYSGSDNPDEWEQPPAVIAMEMAHNLASCERLFVIGVPLPDTTPEWVKPAAPMSQSATTTASASAVGMSQAAKA